MMVELKCPKCPSKFHSQTQLQKHLNRKYPCDSGLHICIKCKRKFQHNTTRYAHQKNCDGNSKSHEEKDQEIDNLQAALAASSGLNASLRDKATTNLTTNNNITQNIVGRDQINNVTQNIFVLPQGKENLAHIKEMSMKQLQEKIGLTPHPKTHIEAFKMIHLDEEHPENHNLLLPDKDSKIIHYCADNNEWKTGPYDQHVRYAIDDDNKCIRSFYGEKEQDQEFYWGYLIHDINRKMAEMDDNGLRPILDGVRDPLHKSTLKLIARHNQDLGMDVATSTKEDALDSRTIPAEIMLEIERNRTKQIEASSKLREAQERTKQLELELELAKLKRQ